MTYSSDDSRKKEKENNKKAKLVAGENARKIALSIAIAGIAAVLVISLNTLQLEAKKATAQSDNPTLGYDIHVTVNKHDSAHLDAQMDHYCKLDDRIVAVCQLYATTNNIEGGGPQLAQVEFIITDEQYLTLPLRERANWHNHAVELTPERGSPTCVELPEGLECSALVDILHHTYGKVITVWDPSDGLPNYPPYSFLVDSPFALNQDLNDNLHNEWLVGDEESGSGDEVPNCGLKQAGPCGSANH